MTAPKHDGEVIALSVSSFFRDHGGGVELVAHQLAAHLARREGWRSVLAAHEHDGRRGRKEVYETLSIRCWNGLERMTGLPLMVPHPADVLRVMRAAAGADILIVHEEIYLSNLALLIVAVLRRRKVVLVKHTGLMLTRSRALGFIQRSLVRFFLRPLAARASAVVFVVEGKRARYDPGRALENAEVIENGIDCTLFHPAEKPPERSRPVVLFVGRFVPLKALPLVRALASAAPGWDFQMIGWGSERPEDWGLANVSVERRPPRERIAEAYRNADVFIFTGFDEGVTLVILEALASGTPVVATDCSTTDDAELAANIALLPLDRLRPEAGVDDWRRKIASVIANRRPGDAARLRAPVLARYSEAASLARYDAVFDRVLAQ